MRKIGSRSVQISVQKQDLTSGNLPKKILLFTLPIIAMGLFQNLFAACDDMVILGIFASDRALAAVGATTYLVNLFVNVFIGLSVGANVVVARLIGAKEEREANRAMHTALTLSLIVGLVLMVLGSSLCRICLEWLDTPADIIAQSTTYLRIYFIGTPALLIFNFGAAILRAGGNAKTPFLYLSLSGAVNVALNMLFVLVCRMDVAGVATGTVISQYLSAGLMILHLLREKGALQFRPRRMTLCGKYLVQILRIGIPTGLNNLVFSISNTQIQSAVNSFGAAAVAGCSAAYTLEHFFYTSTNSVMQADISFVGQNVGAGKHRNIPKILRWCLFYAAGIGFVMGLTVVGLGRPIFGVILDSNAAIEFAMTRTYIFMFFYYMCGIMEVLAGTLRGLGKSLLPTAVTMIGACGLRLVWIHTVFRAMPALGVLFASYPLSWLLTAIAHFVGYLVAMRRLKRQGPPPVEPPDEPTATDKIPTTHELLSTDETPTMREMLATDETPTMHEMLATEETPTTDKISATDNEVPSLRTAPAAAH